MRSGIIVLNKPPGMTSQQAVTRVRRLLGIAKAGHSGSLDPGATGVLPVFLGGATRLAEYVMEQKKEYEAVVSFGLATDTQDAGGRPVAEGDPSGLTEAAIRAAGEQFVGVIQQMPPAYSAVRVQGVRAYALARAGKAVETAAREAVVDALRVLEVDLAAADKRTRFSIECGKGTYVRTICHDWGARLGVPAHMASLVRTRSGPFTLADAQDLPRLLEGEAARVWPPEAAVGHFPVLCLAQEEKRVVLHGAPLIVDAARLSWPEPRGLVRLHAEDGELLAIYRVTEHGDGLSRLVAEKVLGKEDDER